MNPQGHKRPAMAFILVTLFIDILGIGIIIPVLPELVKQFVGGNTAMAGWYVGIIAASYSLMQFLFAPILGALSDRFGRRPVLLLALFGLGIDFVIQGLAPNIAWLFMGRLFAGILGASFSTANAYIADVSTPETRARNFGLVGVAFGLGFICGPALGGLMGSLYLRLPFFVSASLAMLNCLYGYFVLPESLSKEHRSSFTWTKANPFGALERLRRYPIVAGLTSVFIFTQLAQRGLESVWVLHASYRYDWNERTNGLMLGLVGLMAALVQGLLVREVIRRLGERGTVIVGLALSVFTFLGYGLASQGWMIPYIIVLGSLGGVCGPALQSIVAGSVSPSEQGKIQGALTSLMSLTNIVAPLFFTAGLFSYFTSEQAFMELPGAPFLVGAALIALALVIAIRVFRRIPLTVGEPEA